MIATLSVPDEVHKQYVKYDLKSPNKAMTLQLERFKDFSPTDRALVLPVAVRAALEALHQRPFDTPEQLLEWVKRLTSTSIEGTEVQLTELQRRRINARAASRGLDPKAYLQKEVQRALRNHFGG